MSQCETNGPAHPNISCTVRPLIINKKHRTLAFLYIINKYSINNLVHHYHALNFKLCLAQFFVARQHPELSWRQIESHAYDLDIPNAFFSVYHSIKFTVDNSSGSETVDIIHAKPASIDKQGRSVPARFDTVLIHQSDISGLRGMFSRLHLDFSQKARQQK